ncbi:MAG: DnaJ C-terminal domain-containing protein [Candidatus Caenarcaniphilales bacterium]|nr:DnaJ C-terminal domain-containing protein [Candidatus Caenarcaniphilales bacterium]
MVKYEDYYEVLGVNRNASEADIKKAFRKLAREHHPDRHKTDKKAAEAKFKKINEAYSVLSNPEKRAQYDQLGRIPHGSEFRPPPGFDFSGTGDMGSFGELFEMLFNSGGGFRTQSSGGFSPFGGPFNSSGRSSGFQEAQHVKGNNLTSRLELNLEEAYKGCTKKLSLGKHGSIEVKIPAGVNDGNKIRLAGKGSPSPYSGPPGDLLLEVKLKTHDEFKLVNNNIESKLLISVTEAIFGSVKKVRTLNGSVDLTIPSGIQGGQKLRIANQGWLKKGGGKGDHLVQIMIRIPKDLGPEEKELYEKLKSLEESQ